MKNKKIVIGVVAVVIVLAVVGIVVASSGSKDKMDMSSSSDSSATSTNAVTIKNYMFSPATIKVKVGTKVTWTNQDAVSHTITADMKMDGAPDSMDIAQHGTYSFTFSKAGTFKYHCFPHPYMHGTVVVTE